MRPYCSCTRRSAGFTLVELLVVVTIIAILIALLLPAINSAREAARCAQCANNLKQLGLGVLQHVEKYNQYPTGGWGWGWVGDPDRGYDERQPGGLLYNILPFIEQEAIYMMPADGDPDSVTSSQLAGAGEMVQVVLTLANCPTRRRSVTRPWGATPDPANYTKPAVVARTDYAANAGDKDCHPGRMNLWPAHCGNGDCGPNTILDNQTLGSRAQQIADYLPTGIVHPLSAIRPAHVRDGEMCTILLGEKSVNPASYFNGADMGDNENMFIGLNEDVARWTDITPLQDRFGYASRRGFGSPHAGGCHFVLCDGAVRRISYNIDGTTFRRLGNRHDGQNVDMTKY